MIERLLVNDELRERLVTEASEYVLRFDWDDIARRTRAIYTELGEPAPTGVRAAESREQGVGRG
jgi:glycosyltransferase involved in cell wall biosynthesis